MYMASTAGNGALERETRSKGVWSSAVYAVRLCIRKLMQLVASY